MKALCNILKQYRPFYHWIALGLFLTITALFASISLLSLSGWFLAAAAITGTTGYLNYLLAATGVRAFSIIKISARYFDRIVNHDITLRILSNLRVTLFRTLLPLSPTRLAQYQQGELLNRFINDINLLDNLYLRLILPAISILFGIVFFAISLAFFAPTIAMVLAGSMLVISLLLPTLFYIFSKKIGLEMTLAYRQYRTKLVALLQGQAELLMFNVWSHYRILLDTIEQNLLTQQRCQAMRIALAQAILIFFSGAMVTVTLWFCAAHFADLSTPYSYALIALFVFAVFAAFEALSPITTIAQHVTPTLQAVQRVNQIFIARPDVIFSAEGPPAIDSATLAFQNVGFTYEGQPFSVLKNINMHINAGQHIALLGHTGCGKSTLLQLIARTWDMVQGQILLNNQPLSAYSEPVLRSMMSIVTQRVHLFNNTLRENLRIAAPEASDTVLKAVLIDLNLDNLLTNEGLDAWLGEGGRALSGGELRRLGLARALLHSAPLILLDEPTEGLDAATENMIHAQLQKQWHGKTVIWITHRLYGLEKMDQIYIMDNGTIIEHGTHTGLLAQDNSRYAALLQSKQYD